MANEETKEAANPNGSGPKIKRREAWVELPGDYSEFRVRIWVNAPARLWNDMTSGDELMALDAIRKIVLEHNGWCDFDGEQFPPATDPAFYDEIPTELLACVVAAAQQEMQKLPNSMTPQSRRSRRG